TGAVGCAHDGQRGLGHAVVVDLFVQLAVTVNDQAQVGGQGVDHGYTHAVQATGDLVAVVVELSAGVQHRHDHFRCRNAFFMHVGRNTAAVVRHTDGLVAVDHHLDAVAVASQCLVDAVVDQLEHHVVQARAIVGIADVHTRTFADGIQALQDLDAGRAVL